jgi:hypothetical protein
MLPEPRGPDPAAERRLLATIDGDLRSADGSATVTAVRIAWTGAFLDAARRLEPRLVETVREAGEQGTLGPGTDPAGPARARLLGQGRRWRGTTASSRTTASRTASSRTTASRTASSRAAASRD